MKNLAMIVAISENGVIGDGDKMPWKQSEDLKLFKQITTSKLEGYKNCIIMGRKTHDSIGVRLPGRENVILTRDLDYESVGCDVFNIPEAVYDYLEGMGPMHSYVIGGAEIYNLFLPKVDVLYLTRIHAIVSGDIKLDIDLKDWVQVQQCGPHPVDEKNQYPYTFEIYTRK